MKRNLKIVAHPFFSLTIVAIAVICHQACAQSGLRESLERLDKNENGLIDPDEVTPLSRPYLERITERPGSSASSLQKAISIKKLQESARIYHAIRNGVAGVKVAPESNPTVIPFGPEPNVPLVPEFGLANFKFPYILADLEEADRALRKNDQNHDGYIDRAEAKEGKWTHRNPFDDDLNKDNRLNRLELGQRYARRRLLSDDAHELVQKARRTGGEIRRSTHVKKKEDTSQWWRSGGSSHWLTAAVLARFDLNKNGRLEHREAELMGVPPGRIDIDRDGELTRDELFPYLIKLQEEAGDLTEGLPGWFYELDTDRDGQVEMSEFATKWTNEKIREFESLDLNDDGLLTAAEILKAKGIVGGQFRNQNAQILPPHKTIISEIEVKEDFQIRDLNVQVSITHTSTSSLDAFLTGPDGLRVELFSEIGGSGNHFEQTIFDDQSEVSILKAKPPFQGSFRPEGPGLAGFNNKNANGVWQLVIRGTRNERFGMLHSWALDITPQEDSALPMTQENDPEEVTESSEKDILNGLIELVK